MTTSEQTERPIHQIPRASTTPQLNGEWDGPAWGDVPTLGIDHFHPTSSDHRPRTRVKMLYDDAGIYVFFRVEDRYVRAVAARENSGTCTDSCVEVFLLPDPDYGHFNFEYNCGGTLDAGYQPVRKPEPEQSFTPGSLFPRQPQPHVRTYHSMPEIVDPEITEPTVWVIESFIDYALFERFVKIERPGPGVVWWANFYKCASNLSHPHWAAWSPTGEPKPFHRPAIFGRLVFE